MNVNKIKKRIFLKLAIFLPIIIILVGAYYFVLSTKQNKIKKEASIKSDISQTKSNLDKLTANKKRLSEDMDIWRNMSENEKKMSGLRISEAKNIVDELSKKFYLTDVRTTFSKPEKMGDEFSTENITVLESSIKITFKALTDEYVIKFVEAIAKDFPGYIMLDSFTVKADESISENIVRQVAYGQNPQIVSGSVSFLWKDMKYVKPLIESK